ncbi:MAG: CHAT domain-containing protein, partial [Candidatus Sericytochromatia bacterium]
LRRLGGQDEHLADKLFSDGQALDAMGQYTRCLAVYHEALAIRRRLGHEVAMVQILGEIGNAHSDLGQSEQGLVFCQAALALARRLGGDGNMAHALMAIGGVYADLGRLDEAAGAIAESLAAQRRLGWERMMPGTLCQLGQVYEAQDQPEKAGAAYLEASAIAQRTGDTRLASTVLHNMGMLAANARRYPEAIAAFQKSIEGFRRLGRTPDVAMALNNLGMVYRFQYRHAEAAACLRESVALFDQLRDAAEGDARRDFLGRQIATYRRLVSSLAHAGQHEAALQAGERARARVLAETLTQGHAGPVDAGVEALRRTLAPGEAVLLLTPVTRSDTVGMVLTHDSLRARVVSLPRPPAGSAPTAPTPAAEGQRGVALEPLDPETPPAIGVPALVAAYRAHLASPASADSPDAKAMGRALYDHLVAPFEGMLKGIKRLTVVPDGTLGLLPFEALVGADGKYLIERFDVAYAHSLTVRQALRDRKPQAAGKPLLAVGGAVYAPETYKADMSPAVAGLKQPAIKAAYASWGPLAGQTAVLASLKTRGLGAFGNLPGTLAEVDAISGSFQGADVLVGPQASKAELLKRDLAGYRVLHFATHGVADPERPEGSGLLLSVGPRDEDALLSAPEVAKLKLSAEFVCLSACQTGVGKVVGGEGVVGLSQAFLQAGAGGLAMSLWSVDDAGTAAFMSGLYQGGKAPDATKMASLKRQMLKDSRFNSPYFWAPFVYYGR